MERVFIGIGSNLLNPLKRVNNSLRALSNYSSRIKFIAHSPYYYSRPLLNMKQPNFINLVVIIDTSLSALELLDYIQWIEIQEGRVRSNCRWAARSLDIDILLFGNRVISIPELVIPHYDMFNREFVLYPLFELVPNFTFLNGRTLYEYISRISKNGLKVFYKNCSDK